MIMQTTRLEPAQEPHSDLNPDKMLRRGLEPPHPFLWAPPPQGDVSTNSTIAAFYRDIPIPPASNALYSNAG